MLIDKAFLYQLCRRAESSERLRVMHDMRTTPADGSQRGINAMQPGTVVPVHRHKNSCETCIVLQGSIRSVQYNDGGEIIEEHILDATEGPSCISVPAGAWHTVEVLEPDTVIFEAKDGAYAPLTPDDIL